MRPQSGFWRLGLNQNVVVCWLPVPVFRVGENTRCASTKFTSLLFSPSTAERIDHHLEPCGTLWNAVERCGTLWNLVERCGTLWNAVERCGTLWNGWVKPTELMTGVDENW